MIIYSLALELYYIRFKLLNMKHTLLFSIIMSSLIGCSTTPPPPPPTPPTPAACHNIPRWKADTCFAAKSGIVKGDSIVTYFSGDTTLINYHGQKLYVFYKESAVYKYNDSIGAFLSCYISPNNFDTSGAWTKCDVMSPHYWSDTYSTWKDGAMSFTIKTMAPHFDAAANNVYLGYQ